MADLDPRLQPPQRCYRCGRRLARANMIAWSPLAHGPVCRNRRRCNQYVRGQGQGQKNSDLNPDLRGVSGRGQSVHHHYIVVNLTPDPPPLVQYVGKKR